MPVLELGGGGMIHVGDCIAWLEAMADGSADVAIADPPYSEHVHTKSRRAGNGARKRDRSKPTIADRRDLGFDSITPALQAAVARELARVTRRWILIFCSAEMIGDWMRHLQGAGLEHVRVCVWVKPNAAPQFTGDRPAAGHEHIVCAHRRGTRKRWNGGGRNGVFTHNVEQRGRLHTTEKPLSLMLELVELFSDRGELVIDPFAGSGSTGAACIRLGRSFEGAELDPKIARVAIERLAAEVTGSTYEARTAGQAPLFGAAAC